MHTRGNLSIIELKLQLNFERKWKRFSCHSRQRHAPASYQYYLKARQRLLFDFWRTADWRHETKAKVGPGHELLPRHPMPTATNNSHKNNNNNDNQKMYLMRHWQHESFIYYFDR